MWKILFIISLFSLVSCNSEEEQSNILYHPFQNVVTFSIYNPNFWPVMFDSINIPCGNHWRVCIKHNGGDCLKSEIFATYDSTYEVVMPFQSFFCTFDSTDEYDMSQPGDYSIEFIGRKSCDETEFNLETKLLIGSKRHFESDSSRFSFMFKYVPEANILPSNRVYLKKLTH